MTSLLIALLKKMLIIGLPGKTDSCIELERAWNNHKIAIKFFNYFHSLIAAMNIMAPLSVEPYYLHVYGNNFQKDAPYSK